MPKETIATRTETDTGPDGAVLETRNESLCVAWGRQPSADAEAVQITIRQETDHKGRELYSAGLTNYEIGDLIRVLKRARRQTFGHDPANRVADDLSPLVEWASRLRMDTPEDQAIADRYVETLRQLSRAVRTGEQ